MHRAHVLTGLAAVGMVAFANAQAADEHDGFYVGIGIGEATDKVGEFEDSDTSFKVMGGYAFNRYLAAELAWIDAGELQDRVDDLDLTVESEGAVAAVIGKLPLGDWFTAYAKLGYAFYDEKVTARLGSASETEKHSEEDLLYGVGAEINLGTRFKLRAEYEVVDVADADFDIVSLGATWHF